MPEGPGGRAKSIAEVLTTMQRQVRRRIETSERPTYTRCPRCLPSTEEWYNGLLRAVNRGLQNVKPLPDAPELVPIVEELDHAGENLRRVMQAVLARSNIPSGFCSFCGVSWEAETQASLSSRRSPDN